MAQQTFGHQVVLQQPKPSYNDAILTLTDESTPDPFVVQWHGKNYMTFTCGDRVEIWCTHDLLTMGRTTRKVVVWRPPPNTPYSADLWATELHQVQGRWYIYVACADPRYGNVSHRMYILGGPLAHEDPMNPHGWKFLGPIRGLPETQWAIDGTMIHLDNSMFFVYSGWPIPDVGCGDKIQQLFIVGMSTATEASSQPVCICQPTESWECSGESRINEGPQWLESPDGSWRGLVYSCAGSWTRDYKMNTLRYVGGDPLDHRSWQKCRHHLIASGQKPPFGPGHASFVLQRQLGETWAVFHGTDLPTDGWDGRRARVRRVAWTADGPYMGDITGNVVRSPQEFLHGTSHTPHDVNGGKEGYAVEADSRSHSLFDRIGQIFRAC